MNGLIAPGSQALASLTALWAAFLVLSAIGIATNLQVWYQKLYDQRPPAPPAPRSSWLLVPE